MNALFCLIGIVAIAIFAFPGAVGYYGYADIGTIFGLNIGIFFLLERAQVSCQKRVNHIRNWLVIILSPTRNAEG